MRPLNLKRELLLRISLFAVGLFIVAAGIAVDRAGERIRSDIQRTGGTMRQLISDAAARSTTAFDRTLSDVDLSPLNGIGTIVPFCVEVVDLDKRPVARRCFAEPGSSPHLLRGLIAWAVGPDAVVGGTVGNDPGIKIGELSITPNYDWEAAALAGQLLNLLGITAGVLLLNVLVYLPVRRALKPSEEILSGLARMESGDLSVRLPQFPLIELQRIASVFNHLADRLQQTIEEQRRLAARLLDVREEERRHLARELHDEFGQSLTSLQAEAAYAGELARDGVPALRPCADAIAGTSAHMLAALQQLLRQLRPIGLEEFGLAASIEQLVAGWNRRSDGHCRYRLELDGDFADLSDTANVNLYRITQESLTNAARHGKAGEVVVRLARLARRIELVIDNDGSAVKIPADSAGLGLLGMHERVLALGGQIDISPRPGGGMRVRVELPLPAASEGAAR